MESTVSYQYSVVDRVANIYPQSVTSAVEALSVGNRIESRGAVYTRIEIAEFILDLVGFTVDYPLHQKRILEPSFGGGEFLLPIIGRLLAAWRASDSVGDIVDVLGNAIVAVELHYTTFINTRTLIWERLVKEGIAGTSATVLVNRWLIHGDFLLENIEGKFDFIVGNPPYVRQEMIPAPLLTVYRDRYQTIYDRADLYIPFIERSLLLLAPKGHLGFICADRWMKNRYGGPLRNFIDERFHLKIYVDMVGTQAFQSDVSTYPAITVISCEKTGITRIAHRPVIESTALTTLAKELCANQLSQGKGQVRELAKVTYKAEPWLLEAPDQMALVRRLEMQFPTLEETACKVGIGVATGLDKVFIGKYDELDVELDRKLPLVMTRDIRSGEVQWQGQWVINPFAEDGKLVDLENYPRLHHYLMNHYNLVAERHCARKTPINWYRTIDRITPALAKREKLLIPDIKGEANVVFEKGELYPHHNLYYIISESWDLRALQAVLLSGVSRLFITLYSTQIRGGYLRFQAQYLRRIRIPHWNTVSESLRRELITAAKNRDIEACNRAVFSLYDLTDKEQSALGGNE